MHPILLVLAALGLTLAVELPAAACLGLRTRGALAAVALMNVITNPVLNVGLLLTWRLAPARVASPAGAAVTIAAGECAVVAGEIRLLRWSSPSSSAGLAGRCVLLNAASAGIGLALWQVLPA